MSRTLFVSYSSADRAWVDQLAASLAEAGFEAWVDHQNLECGTEWPTSVPQGPQEADAFILVLSHRSLTAEHLPLELSLAEESQRPIVAVQLEAAQEDAELKYRLAGLKRVSFIDVPWATAIASLVEVLPSANALDEDAPLWTGATLPGRRPPGRSPSERTPVRRTGSPLTTLLMLAIGFLIVAAVGYFSSRA